MKRFFAVLMLTVALFLLAVPASANIFDDIGGFFGDVGDAIGDAAGDVADWVGEAAGDAADWVSGAATDAWDWTTGAINDAGVWIGDAASDIAHGVDGFFNPPSTSATPATVPEEPALPEGTLKLYLGYEAAAKEKDTGYSVSISMDDDDPHLGITMGKFYVSGFSQIVSEGDNPVFLRTVGNDLELHFQLVQDINVLQGDTNIHVKNDDGGYDTFMNVPPTYFGRGALIVRFTDYENNQHEPQIYTDFLAAKMSGDANTVINLNEEGDYEVALDYTIEKKSNVLGTSITSTSYYDYQILFKFSVRNGNCIVFPFDTVTGEELHNASVTENGFYLDLARSRYLDINVKKIDLIETPSGYVKDIRFNRPAKDGTSYTAEGIYEISVYNDYTGERTEKIIVVGTEEMLTQYMSITNSN